MIRYFEVENGWIYLKEHNKRLLCIPDVWVGQRKARELAISEAHSLLAHLGSSKTVAYLRDYVWWKDLVPETRSCVMCMRNKPSNQKPYGLLNPLPVPVNP